MAGIHFISPNILSYNPPAAGPAGFDPTTGDTLPLYWWYDFTDDSTMSFTSANNINTITSKGSDSTSLVSTYATSKPTWQGDYTQFTGTATTNNKMTADVIFPINRLTDSWTLIMLGNFSWPAGTSFQHNYRYCSYIDSNNTVPNACQWDITPSTLNFGGTQKNIETCIAGAPAATPWIYGGFYSGTDNYNYKLYGGETETGYTAIIYRYDHTTLTSEFGIALDTSNMCAMSNTMQTYTTGTGTAFTLGGRAQSNTLNGGIMKMQHTLFYNSKLSDGEIDTMLGSYTPPV